MKFEWGAPKSLGFRVWSGFAFGVFSGVKE